MSETITPVKILVDLYDPIAGKYDALLNLTITIEDGMLTLGSYGGPDMFRAKMKDLMGENDE